MTLPEPARRLWLAYGAIEEHVLALSRGPHEIRLGGGSVLAARWKHRTSYDIDLTLSPEARTTRLTAENNPALDAALRALGGTPEHEPPNYRVKFEAGWIDIATLEPTPAKGAAATAVHGKTVRVLSTTQILRGKLERGTRSPVRDVFDFITARATDRGGLAAAVNCLAATRIHEIAYWWEQANETLRVEAGAPSASGGTLPLSAWRARKRSAGRSTSGPRSTPEQARPMRRSRRSTATKPRSRLAATS